MKFLRAAGTNETDFPSAGRPFLSYRGYLFFHAVPGLIFILRKKELNRFSGCAGASAIYPDGNSLQNGV